MFSASWGCIWLLLFITECHAAQKGRRVKTRFVFFLEQLLLVCSAWVLIGLLQSVSPLWNYFICHGQLEYHKQIQFWFRLKYSCLTYYLTTFEILKCCICLLSMRLQLLGLERRNEAAGRTAILAPSGSNRICLPAALKLYKLTHYVWRIPKKHPIKFRGNSSFSSGLCDRLFLGWGQCLLFLVAWQLLTDKKQSSSKTHFCFYTSAFCNKQICKSLRESQMCLIYTGWFHLIWQSRNKISQHLIKIFVSGSSCVCGMFLHLLPPAKQDTDGFLIEEVKHCLSTTLPTPNSVPVHPNTL